MAARGRLRTEQSFEALLRQFSAAWIASSAPLVLRVDGRARARRLVGALGRLLAPALAPWMPCWLALDALDANDLSNEGWTMLDARGQPLERVVVPEGPGRRVVALLGAPLLLRVPLARLLAWLDAQARQGILLVLLVEGWVEEQQWAALRARAGAQGELKGAQLSLSARTRPARPHTLHLRLHAQGGTLSLLAAAPGAAKSEAVQADAETEAEEGVVLVADDEEQEGADWDQDSDEADDIY